MEQCQITITVIFLSQIQWQDIKPTVGAAPEPYYIDVKPLTKLGTLSPPHKLYQLLISQLDIVQTLSSRFTSISQKTFRSSSKYAQCYTPSLSHLYTHYINMICDVCFPFIHDIDELAYIAAARWPGFVKPIMSSHPSTEGEPIAPSEDVRLRLTRVFNATITNALESLYPRLTNATEGAAANEPDSNILEQPFDQFHTPNAKSGNAAGALPQYDATGLSALPRMSKFILVASYITSTNPTKSDLRMFGRGLDEKI